MVYDDIWGMPFLNRSHMGDIRRRHASGTGSPLVMFIIYQDNGKCGVIIISYNKVCDIQGNPCIINRAAALKCLSVRAAEDIFIPIIIHEGIIGVNPYFLFDIIKLWLQGDFYP